MEERSDLAIFVFDPQTNPFTPQAIREGGKCPCHHLFMIPKPILSCLKPKGLERVLSYKGGK
jgi:hypothetical protein